MKPWRYSYDQLILPTVRFFYPFQKRVLWIVIFSKSNGQGRIQGLTPI